MNAMAATWRPFYIGVGSNLDDPGRQVQMAFDCLARIDRTCVYLQSPLYRSAPVGGIEQPDFVNAVAAGVSCLGAVALLREMQVIERERGRVRNGERWGPRVLDLDLLVYSGERSDDPELTLPHPRIAERNFVLLPLRDIAPELVIPGLGRVATIPVDNNNPRIVRISE